MVPRVFYVTFAIQHLSIATAYVVTTGGDFLPRRLLKRW